MVIHENVVDDRLVDDEELRTNEDQRLLFEWVLIILLFVSREESKF
jgi:hypothetical protein